MAANTQPDHLHQYIKLDSTHAGTAHGREHTTGSPASINQAG